MKKSCARLKKSLEYFISVFSRFLGLFLLGPLRQVDQQALNVLSGVIAIIYFFKLSDAPESKRVICLIPHSRAVSLSILSSAIKDSVIGGRFAECIFECRISYQLVIKSLPMTIGIFLSTPRKRC